MQVTCTSRILMSMELHAFSSLYTLAITHPSTKLTLRLQFLILEPPSFSPPPHYHLTFYKAESHNCLVVSDVQCQECKQEGAYNLRNSHDNQYTNINRATMWIQKYFLIQKFIFMQCSNTYVSHITRSATCIACPSSFGAKFFAVLM